MSSSVDERDSLLSFALRRSIVIANQGVKAINEFYGRAQRNRNEQLAHACEAAAQDPRNRFLKRDLLEAAQMLRVLKGQMDVDS